MKVIKYGQYPQVDNQVLPIEWYVLSEWNGKLLLLSKYAIDYRPFDYNWGHCISWEDSALRKWLNEDFYFQAFSRDEKANIVPTYVSNGYYYDRKEHWEEATSQDNIFLLSARELREFIPTEARKCLITDFALKKLRFIYPYPEDGVYEYEECDWWIRNSGLHSDDVALCLNDGTFDMQGCANGFSCYVRPAIRIISPYGKNGQPAPKVLNLFTGCWSYMLQSDSEYQYELYWDINHSWWCD